MKQPVWLSWSSGKDSAWSLHTLQQDPNFTVTALFTTVNKAFDRVAMHAVRRSLLEQQARAARLPLHIIELPYPCSNEAYEAAMHEFFDEVRKAGVLTLAFGDLFLDDIRQYREAMLSGTGLEAHFPLWRKLTKPLAAEMIAEGVKAIVTCVDPKQINGDFAGRWFDHDLLAALPNSADPCGENGEFHTFVTAGPMFETEIPVSVGESLEREGFVFCDVQAKPAG